MSKDLTKVQKNILDFITTTILTRQLPPTLAEIAKKFGYKNRSTAGQHLKALEVKGYIRRTTKLSRGIELNSADKFFIPRPVLGEVAAGNPLMIYPDAIDTVELPKIIKVPKDSFLLKVKGNSLEDAFIFSGDVVIVNPNVTPKNGKIVVAVLDDSAVVKRYFSEKDKIILKSENKSFQPIELKIDYDKFKIIGVVIGIYRTMSN